MIVFNSIEKFTTGSDDVQRQINFMDDGFSAEKKGASERANWFPQKMERVKKRRYFFKKLISHENGASEVELFFFKERSVTLA